MEDYDYNPLPIDTTVGSCTSDNSIVDLVLLKETMEAETEDQIIELSIEKLYFNLKESIKI